MIILVSAESFGYGPITTGLNVVKELIKYPDVTVDFIGSGIALEQAKISGYFNQIYVCDTFDFTSLEKQVNIFKKYDIFLSAENINGAIFALNNGIKNTYYLDNLMWMWDKIPSGLNDVRKYFISEIISCKKNFKRIGREIKNPVFVGPIREINTKKSLVKKQVIINIGGAESFLLNHSLIVKFYNKIINDILATDKIKEFESIIICGGSGVLKKIKIEHEIKNIKICTLSHEDYLKEMDVSSHCILASGLGNFIETIGKDKNIMYLPAINYSQLLQIEYYEKDNFGFDILNWPMFDFYKEIPEYLEEEQGVEMVVENIEAYLKKDYRDLVINTVDKFLTFSQKGFFAKRNNYIRKFDKDASRVIAKTIYEDNI